MGAERGGCHHAAGRESSGSYLESSREGNFETFRYLVTSPSMPLPRLRALCASGKIPAVTYGRARRRDKPVLFSKLLHERLNFLSPYLCDVERSIVVARDARSDKLIGCAKIGRIGDETYELSSVVVDEAYRGHGIGKALIQQALDLAPAEATIFLTTLDDRQDLYRRFAFEVCDLDKDEVPIGLKVEMAVGAALFSVTNLIVMRRRQSYDTDFS